MADDLDLWMIQQAFVMGKSGKLHRRKTRSDLPNQKGKSKTEGPSPKGLKLWGFRITVLILAPLAFLLVLELALRVVGFGYPTSFFLETEAEGRSVLIQNNRFGWRFFGPDYARTPEVFAITPEASPGTIRIFVLGESAAMGDPKPEFGLPRMLEAMLSLRYPSTDFEVVNVSMTAINSHVIREIAKDCTAADGDIWVLYIGNNEVVGPFGGGTVFGPQAPPLATIRSTLALKSTRTGQLLDAVISGLNPPEAGKESWGGMQMFLDKQLAADDPRMTQVYGYFQRNLEDIVGYGQRAGVGMVICNVAVNLKDCAPFGSQFNPATDPQQTAVWKSHHQRGIGLQEQGLWSAALAAYEEAEKIDADVAELHYRKGQCALELGNRELASLEFSRARDLDTLRFRSDSRMQQIVGAIVSKENQPQIRFADTIAAFADESPDHIPGKKYFYEHVHLTWEGNYLLSRTIAEQLIELLPIPVKTAADVLPAWPSADECARRLVWTDKERQECLGEVRERLNKPPFTLQLNHQQQIDYLANTINSIEPLTGEAGLNEMLQACESALTSAPDDSYLLKRIADLRLKAGDIDGALAAARRVTVLLPHSASARDHLGIILVQSGRLAQALDVFEQGVRLDPSDHWIRHHLAQAYFRAGNSDAALKQWKQLIRQQPKFGTAHIGVGQLLEAQGKTDAANEHYRQALLYPVETSSDLALLGRLCLKKGWLPDALKNLHQAAILSPTDASIRYDLAAVLKAMGREKEAAEQLAAARRYDTNEWRARFQAGLDYGRQGRPQEAVLAFREVVRLKPDLAEGHLNLGLALFKIGQTNEAIQAFSRVIELSPENEMALRYLEALKAEPVDAGSE